MRGLHFFAQGHPWPRKPLRRKGLLLLFFICNVSRFVVYWKSNMNPIDEIHLLLNLVSIVQRAAEDSYNLSYGWSEIVECWTRKEIYDELNKEKITTAEKAIEHFAFIANIRSEHAQEIESTIW